MIQQRAAKCFEVNKPSDDEFLSSPRPPWVKKICDPTMYANTVYLRQMLTRDLLAVANLNLLAVIACAHG